MTKEELQERSLQFAADIRLISDRVRAIPGGRNTADQLLNCSTSMAANYRAACRGRSRAEFIAKLGTVVEESDETLDEAKQLRAIFAASYGTARSNYGEREDEHRRRRRP
jgi:four helix bundle protein